MAGWRCSVLPRATGLPLGNDVDWYYKAALVVGLIWATARALGVYGDAARDLDIGFLFGFMLTVGGWAAVFLIVDRVAKFLGWRRPPKAAGGTSDVGAPPITTEPVVTEARPAHGQALRAEARLRRRSRR